MKEKLLKSHPGLDNLKGLLYLKYEYKAKKYLVVEQLTTNAVS